MPIFGDRLRWFHVVGGGIMAGIALLFVFPPHHYMFKVFSRFAVEALLLFLVLGFVFLFIRQYRLMVMSMLCCSTLCVFLKQSTTGDLNTIKYAQRTAERTLKIALLNTSDAADAPTLFLESILESQADVVAIQEVTPDWDALLLSKLTAKYPYHATMSRVDLYGMAIYAQHPIIDTDTIFYKDIPSLYAGFQWDSLHPLINLFMAYPVPATSDDAFAEIDRQLQDLAAYAVAPSKPFFALGDYHMEPWTNEIANFRKAARVRGSRLYLNGGIFRRPVQYIFYSEQLECLDFHVLSNDKSDFIGFIGTYQFKMDQHVE